MISGAFIMGFIGGVVGFLIGVLIFSSVAGAIHCPGYNATDNTYDMTVQGYDECNNGKQIAWAVIGILPVSFFFALFGVFGGFGSNQN